MTLHLVDRNPTVTPEQMVEQLVPPEMFSEVSFDSYIPDPNEPTQAAAVQTGRAFVADWSRRGRALPAITLSRSSTASSTPVITAV